MSSTTILCTASDIAFKFRVSSMSVRRWITEEGLPVLGQLSAGYVLDEEVAVEWIQEHKPKYAERLAAA